MKITIIGGGNIGTQFAVHCAVKNHSTTIYTSRPTLFHGDLTLISNQYSSPLTGKVLATNNLEQACKNADLIFITLPAFCLPDIAQKIRPYLSVNTILGLIPGTGGGEIYFKSHVQRGGTLFGLQRVPSVARVKEYGKIVQATGYRNTLHIATMPANKANDCATIVQQIFDIPCEIIKEYLSLTLTPSNPILHTSRLYTLFKDYQKGITYSSMPLFYEDWSDESSKMIFTCDAELQKLCSKLKEFDLRDVVSLKKHYESNTPEQLTQKIKSIAGFKGIQTPHIQLNDNSFIPDLNSRYFTADFSFGLEIIAQIAQFIHLKLENIIKLLNWYNTISIEKSRFNYQQNGITNYQEFIDFYKNN